MSYNLRHTPERQQCSCGNKSVNRRVFDHKVRYFCDKCWPNTLELGNCYICAGVPDPSKTYVVGFDVDKSTNYYITCGHKHFKMVDELLQKTMNN
jgi:hypothetical protein